jgi:putative endonuclease
MRREKHYYIYILTNPSRTLYTGITNNIRRRVEEHKRKEVPGFAAQYNITRLVYFEVFEDVRNAIAWEEDQGVDPRQARSSDQVEEPEVGWLD